MKIPGVKLTGEYAQLADLVEIAYWEDRRALEDALEDAAFPLWGCETAAYLALVEWREELRQQGTNYPDAYKADTPPKLHLEDEF